VLPGGLLLIAMIATLMWAGRRRTKRSLAALARSLGLNYRADDVLDLLQRYRSLTLMREGHDRRLWNVMSGPTQWGALSCFAYRYEVGFGVHRTVRSYLLAVLETDRQWGRVALRHSLGDAPESSPGARPCSPAPLSGPGKGRWTVSGRADDPGRTLPQGLLDWLDSVEGDLCLELCDHLVALQVPLAGADWPAAWLIDVVQQVAKQLSLHTEHGANSDQPALTGLRGGQPGETGRLTAAGSAAGSGGSHARS
jgi:hypothetical protein